MEVTCSQNQEDDCESVMPVAKRPCMAELQPGEDDAPPASGRIQFVPKLHLNALPEYVLAQLFDLLNLDDMARLWACGSLLLNSRMSSPFYVPSVHIKTRRYLPSIYGKHFCAINRFAGASHLDFEWSPTAPTSLGSTLPTKFLSSELKSLTSSGGLFISDASFQSSNLNSITVGKDFSFDTLNWLGKPLPFPSTLAYLNISKFSVLNLSYLPPSLTHFQCDSLEWFPLHGPNRRRVSSTGYCVLNHYPRNLQTLIIEKGSICCQCSTNNGTARLPPSLTKLKSKIAYFEKCVSGCFAFTLHEQLPHLTELSLSMRQFNLSRDFCTQSRIYASILQCPLLSSVTLSIDKSPIYWPPSANLPCCVTSLCIPFPGSDWKDTVEFLAKSTRTSSLAFLSCVVFTGLKHFGALSPSNRIRDFTCTFLEGMNFGPRFSSLQLARSDEFIRPRNTDSSESTVGQWISCVDGIFNGASIADLCRFPTWRYARGGNGKSLIAYYTRALFSGRPHLAQWLSSLHALWDSNSLEEVVFNAVGSKDDVAMASLLTIANDEPYLWAGNATGYEWLSEINKRCTFGWQRLLYYCTCLCRIQSSDVLLDSVTEALHRVTGVSRSEIDNTKQYLYRETSFLRKI